MKIKEMGNKVILDLKVYDTLKYNERVAMGNINCLIDDIRELEKENEKLREENKNLKERIKEIENESQV